MQISSQLYEYKAFSKAFDLPEQREWIYYDLRGRVAPSQKTYAAYVRERELQATAVRSATEMHEKAELGISALEGTREYTTSLCTDCQNAARYSGIKPPPVTSRLLSDRETTTRQVLRVVSYLARRLKARSALLNHSRPNFELKFPRQMIYYGQGTITLSQ